MSVGINIKKRRFELRMSQQELAQAMGYKTRSTIAKIESGENDVSQKKLQRFAAVLDTTVEALISDYGAAPAAVPAAVEKKEKIAVVILAGGKSGRNRQNIPSQFISVHGKPILVYSMDAYQAHPAVDDIYVVCLKGWEDIVKAYAGKFGISKLRGVIPGGSSGILSLKNALTAIERRYGPEDVLIIQEATRPMVSVELISSLLQACWENGSATVCHSMDDYVQFDLADGKASYLDRNAVIALQSPEAHRMRLIREVFAKAREQALPLTESCCTMLMHRLGYPINFIRSSINNIKITREEDLAAFGAIVQNFAVR